MQFQDGFVVTARKDVIDLPQRGHLGSEWTRDRDAEVEDLAQTPRHSKASTEQSYDHVLVTFQIEFEMTKLEYGGCRQYCHYGGETQKTIRQDALGRTTAAPEKKKKPSEDCSNNTDPEDPTQVDTVCARFIKLDWQE